MILPVAFRAALEAGQRGCGTENVDAGFREKQREQTIDLTPRHGFVDGIHPGLECPVGPVDPLAHSVDPRSDSRITRSRHHQFGYLVDFMNKTSACSLSGW